MPRRSRDLPAAQRPPCLGEDARTRRSACRHPSRAPRSTCAVPGLRSDRTARRMPPRRRGRLARSPGSTRRATRAPTRARRSARRGLSMPIPKAFVATTTSRMPVQERLRAPELAREPEARRGTPRRAGPGARAQPRTPRASRRVAVYSSRGGGQRRISSSAASRFCVATSRAARRGRCSGGRTPRTTISGSVSAEPLHDLARTARRPSP